MKKIRMLKLLLSLDTEERMLVWLLIRGDPYPYSYGCNAIKMGGIIQAPVRSTKVKEQRVGNGKKHIDSLVEVWSHDTKFQAERYKGNHGQNRPSIRVNHQNLLIEAISGENQDNGMLILHLPHIFV